MPVHASSFARVVRVMKRLTWPKIALSNAARSFAATAAISFCTNGWQRIAPWPKMIIERVRMFAPSTVIADRHRVPRARRAKLRGPRWIALAAVDVHRVGDDLRACASVRYALQMADGTAGFSPASSAPQVSVRVARHQVGVCRAMRASGFLDAFEAADRRLELLAHARVRAADARRQLRRADD